MIITEKILHYYFDGVDIIDVSVELNKAGIINSLNNRCLHIEYPTIRPDCNALIGILIEIAAVMNCGLSIDLISLNKYKSMVRSNTGITYFLGKIDDGFWNDFPNDIQFSILKDNNLLGRNKQEMFRNYCAMMYGAIIFFQPQVDKDESLDFNDVSVELIGDEYYLDIKSDKYLLLENENYNSKYIITPIMDPVIVKNKFDLNSKSKNGLYFYYIRESNCCFVNKLYEDICGKNSMCYSNDINKKNVFFVSVEILEDGIGNILDEHLEKEDILNLLSKLGYVRDNNYLYAPRWRTDITNIQDVANDVFRLLDKDLGYTNCIYEKDYIDFYELFSVKEQFALSGFYQLMSRPFVSEEDSEIMMKLYEHKFEGVQLKNPYNEEKNFMQCSHYINCIAGLKKYDRCFEISNIKRLINGKYKEQNIIGWGVFQKKDDPLPDCLVNLFNVYLQEEELEWNVEVRSEKEIIWRIYDGCKCIFLLVFEYISKRKIMVFGEQDAGVYLGYDKRKKYFRKSGEYITRKYSMDLILECPSSFLKRIVEKVVEDNLIDFGIVRMSLYMKNDKWYFNYIFEVIYDNIKKSDLALINEKMMNKLNKLNLNYGDVTYENG